MKSDPYSLNNLQDLVEPGPLSGWPPPAGWWWLLILALALAVLGMWRWRIRYRRTAFRREGLAVLAELEGGTPSVGTISQLLKRVALAARPREEVAALSGDRWTAWLARDAGRALPVPAEKALASTYTDPGAAAPPELLDFARSWIRDLSPR